MEATFDLSVPLLHSSESVTKETRACPMAPTQDMKDKIATEKNEEQIRQSRSSGQHAMLCSA